MSGFWAVIDSKVEDVSKVTVLMDAGFNPHEIRTNKLGHPETPLSSLVIQGRTEEVYAILSHSRFDYAVEIAYFLHATLDRIIKTDNPIFYTLISDQMKNDLQLYEVLRSFPTIEAVLNHLEPIVRHLKKMKPAERVQYSNKMKVEHFITNVSQARPGALIDLEEGLDYDAVMLYMDDEEEERGSALSVMIRKEMDANALILLSNTNYQFVEGSLYALRAAVRMKKDGLITLLVNALLKSQYTFSRKEITDNFKFFHDSGKTYLAIEMMNRAKDLPSEDPLIKLVHKIAVEAEANPEAKAEELVIYNRYIRKFNAKMAALRGAPIPLKDSFAFDDRTITLKNFKNTGVFTSTESYIIKGYEQQASLKIPETPPKIKKRLQNLDENVSEPDSEFVRGGRYSL